MARRRGRTPWRDPGEPVLPGKPGSHPRPVRDGRLDVWRPARRRRQWRIHRPRRRARHRRGHRRDPRQRLEDRAEHPDRRAYGAADRCHADPDRPPSRRHDARRGPADHPPRHGRRSRQQHPRNGHAGEFLERPRRRVGLGREGRRGGQGCQRRRAPAPNHEAFLRPAGGGAAGRLHQQGRAQIEPDPGGAGRLRRAGRPGDARRP